MFKKSLLALILVVGANYATLPAFADYIIKPPAEDYFVHPDSWSLKKAASSGEYDNLEVSIQGTKRKWPIDMFTLADRISSDSICTGTYKKEMQTYLSNFAALPASQQVVVECIARKKGGPLVMVAIFKYQKTDAWKKACKTGSRCLKLSPEQVLALGGEKVYQEKLANYLEANRKLIGTR